MVKPLYIPDGEYGVACQDCRYTRKFGKAVWDARRAARKHAHQYADHVVCLTKTEIVQRYKGYTPKLVPDGEFPF
jgi:hypothetical protein